MKMKQVKRAEFIVDADRSGVRMPTPGETVTVQGKPYILDAVIPRPNKGKAGWPKYTFVCHVPEKRRSP